MDKNTEDITSQLPVQNPGVQYRHVAQQTQQTNVAASVQQPPKKHKGLGKKIVLVVCIVLVASMLGAAGMFVGLHMTGALNKNVITQASGDKITINAEDKSTDLAKAVAAKDLPSVASITVTDGTSVGVGSGVILDTDGNIITNYHVIENAKEISVTIDEKSYEGKVVGKDVSSDLAVVKVDLAGAQVTPMEIGDSSKLSVGDWVMSIGSPFGLDQSVTTGIVSSLYRSTLLPSKGGTTIYANLIQTDAAINPGNSGGALVNSQGQLIGINSIIESESGSSAGVGFAIPSNYAIDIAKTIIAGKTVEHPYFGAALQTVTADNAREAHLDVKQGAYIVKVSASSPAADAGLKKGDVVVAFGDQEINSADALILAVRSHNIGDKVPVKIIRDGKEQTIDVTLASDNGDGANGQKNSSSSERDSEQGNSLEDLFGSEEE